MKRVLWCFLIILVGQGPVSGQMIIRMDDYAGFVREQNLGDHVRDPKKKGEFIGSPYLRDTFQQGAILMKDGVKYTGIPFRYNIYLDEMEFLGVNQQIWALAEPSRIQYIELEKDKLVYRPYFINKKLQKGFFIVLAEGKMKLFSKPRKLVKQTRNVGVYRNAPPPKFVGISSEYYLQEGNKMAKLITTRNRLPDLFPDRKKEITAFIKQHKVKTNKPETLVKLVRYYNELSEKTED